MVTTAGTPLSVLQKARRRIVYNTVFRSGKKGARRFLLLGIMGALFALGDYAFFMRILVYLDGLPLAVGEILIIQLLNTLTLTLFSMLIFSNLIASISTLFMSRDLDFLMSSPIPARNILVSKFVVTLFNSSWMAVLFGAPIFIAYGRLYYAESLYYLTLPLVMIPFVVAPAGIGVMVTMALMRFFPARRTYQILSFVGVAFFAGMVMFLRFMQPENYVGRHVADADIIQFVERLKAPDYPWLPSSILTRAVSAGAVSDWKLYVTEAALLFAVAALIVAAAWVIGYYIYFTGWSSGYGARETVMPKEERPFYRLFRRIIAVAPPDMRAILLKDMKLFWRETGQWSQLFMLGALVVVYLFNIKNLPLNTVQLKNGISILNIGLAGIVLAAVAARFVFSTTSVEGRSFWAVSCAPINFTRFLWAKFLLYLFPLMLLSEILVVVSNFFLEADPYIMVVSTVTIGFLTAGLTGLGVGLGALYPKFDYENIAEIGATTGAILYMMAALTYTAVIVMIIARPVHLHIRGKLPDFEGQEWLFYGAAVVVTILVTLLPIWRGTVALRNVET